MKKIFIISIANIKKTIGNTISLLIMFLISALLLNAGLMVFINFGNFFDNTSNELNSSDSFFIISNNLYDQDLNDYIYNHSNVLEVEKEDNLWTTATVNYNGADVEVFLNINNADVNRELSKWKFVGDHLPPTDMSIYLPTFYQINSGYELGDEFVIDFRETKMTFIISGFIEDVFFSCTETGLIGFYFPSEVYEHISSTLGSNAKVTKLYVNMEIVNKDLETDIKNLTNAETLSSTADLDNSIFSLDIIQIKGIRVMMSSMISILIVFFAIMIAIVCLIMVRFRIGNSIEDDMIKIGSLKAIGYTSKQIIASIVLQFSLIAFVGTFIGTGLSYLITPLLSNIFANQSGLIWVQDFDIAINLICLLVIILIVLLVSLITSRRIHKLNPIVALRGGLSTHNFRKNYLPLSKSRGNLSFILSIKSMLNNMKQSIMIGVVCLAISFVGSCAVIMFYNTVIDISAFEETPGIEITNAEIIIAPETDSNSFSEKILNMDNVRKVQYIEQISIYMEDTQVYAYIMKDYNLRETNSIYKGRYPIHKNEIAVSGYLAEIINKNLEDTVLLRLGDVESEFIITGFTQGSTMMGMHVSLTLDGIKEFNPNFKEASLMVYLDEGTDAAEFIKEVDRLYKDEINVVLNMDEMMKIGVGPYLNIVSKVGVAILVITILIIILVLYFVINSSLIRRKREVGIQKALGFTTFQLMNQISLAFIFPIIIGVIVGSQLGLELTNPLMSIAQKSMAIMKANYKIAPVWVILFGVSLVIVSYITSLLITSRIRKISAYNLVVE